MLQISLALVGRRHAHASAPSRTAVSSSREAISNSQQIVYLFCSYVRRSVCDSRRCVPPLILDLLSSSWTFSLCPRPLTLISNSSPSFSCLNLLRDSPLAWKFVFVGFVSYIIVLLSNLVCCQEGSSPWGNSVQGRPTDGLATGRGGMRLCTVNRVGGCSGVGCGGGIAWWAH